MPFKKRQDKVLSTDINALKRDLSFIKDINILEDISIASFTSFGIGGVCRLFLEPYTYKALRQVKNYLDANLINYYVLGGGSNILAPDKGIDCILSLRGLRAFSIEMQGGIEQDSISLRVGAGFSLKGLISWCSQNGFSGLEPLVCIPASVGGAVRMNAGTKEGSISDVVTRILVLKEGELFWIDKERIPFGYRDIGLDDNTIICASEFRLKRQKPVFVKKNIFKFIYKRRKTQPIEAKSAGCIFKNPKGDYAGRLIELCGFKGRQIGNAQVSTKHANFIINLGGASQHDVLELIELIRQKVKKEFFKELLLEIKVWGVD